MRAECKFGGIAFRIKKFRDFSVCILWDFAGSFPGSLVLQVSFFVLGFFMFVWMENLCVWSRKFAMKYFIMHCASYIDIFVFMEL